MASLPIAEIAVDKLRVDGGTQIRCELNEEHIEERLRPALRKHGRLPPIDVIYDGRDYWPWDGLHRIEAHIRERDAADGKQYSLIYARIASGTQRDAVLLACGANADHGLQRTPDDERRAVARMLADKEWATWPNTRIANHCGVSNQRVAEVRGPSGAAETRMVVRNGTTYPMATGRIGQRPAPMDEDEDPPRQPRAKPATQRTPKEGVRWSILLPADRIEALEQAAADNGDKDWDRVILEGLDLRLAKYLKRAKQRT